MSQASEKARKAVRNFNNGVINFMWDRLPLQECEMNRVPSLAEDWFAEDALAGGSPFVWRKASPEHSHRLLYRYAVKQNVENMFRRGHAHRKPEWFMLEQMLGLIGLSIVAMHIAKEQGVIQVV